MPWPSIFSKKTVSEPTTPAQVDEPVPLAVLEKSEAEKVVPVVKKPRCACACAPVGCACAPVVCAPVVCAPVSCLPLRLLCKRSQPLVLRSIPPAQNENQTSVKAESVPDVLPGQASSTEASSQAAQ